MGTSVLSFEEVTQRVSSHRLRLILLIVVDEVLSQPGFFQKRDYTMGSMNLEEFLKGWTCENNNQSPSIDPGNCSSLQRHGSLGISGNFSEKIDDEVWGEIQQGGNIKGGIKREVSMGEMTLEDFLSKEGAIDECPLVPLDVGVGVGVGPQCETTPGLGQKRHPLERGIEKKLSRKIKNRESAARSRARKQAYHNELVGKVSCLEEQNMRLKKEQEMENRFSMETSHEPKFQLRRTSSAIF